MAKQIKTKKPKKLRPMSQEDVKLASDVKKANQRLRELEKQGMENSPAYKAAERLAFNQDKAMGLTGSGQIKFRTDVAHMDYNERKHLAAEVRKFLEAETSTVKGVKAVKERALEEYKKTVEDEKKHKIIDDFGDDEGINWAEWLNLWGTAIARQYKMMYGSSFTQMIIDTLAHKNLSLEDAEQFLEDHFGEPLARIIAGIDRIDMEPGEMADGEGGSTFEWSDLFAAGGDTDLPF